MALVAGLVLVVAFLYVRRSRSLTAQEQTLKMLQRLDEGSERIGGVKANDGTWAFPTTAGTNQTGAMRITGDTNQAPGRRQD